MRTVTLAGLALTVAAAGPAAAKIKDWKVTPTSKEAVVIMRADRQPFDYMLVLSRDAASGFGSRVHTIRVNGYDFAPFTGRTLAPGTYKINNLVQQGQWSTCFGAGTVAFTVQPGKVYYLGALNTLPLLADLQRSAVARGKTAMSSGSIAMGWEPAVKPEFTPPSAEELTALRQFVAKAMPRTTAPVEALATVPTSFGMTGGEKLMQVCG